MKHLSEPKTNRAEVLHSLILNGKCKGSDFTFVDYRKRVSELKRYNGIIFDSVPTKFVNKRGKKSTYSTYILRTPIKDAKMIYENLNK